MRKILLAIAIMFFWSNLVFAGSEERHTYYKRYDPSSGTWVYSTLVLQALATK